MDQGNLTSETARTHRLGLYLKSKDRRLSRNIAKKSVITNSKQLTQKKSVDSYKDNLWRQKLEFREARQQSLKEMKELRKFQSSTFDTIARRKLIEGQNTILELSGRVQELQKRSKSILRIFRTLNVFCRFSCVIISSLSTRIASIDFQYRTEMPVQTITKDLVILSGGDSSKKNMGQTKCIESKKWKWLIQ